MEILSSSNRGQRILTSSQLFFRARFDLVVPQVAESLFVRLESGPRNNLNPIRVVGVHWASMYICVSSYFCWLPGSGCVPMDTGKIILSSQTLSITS